MTKYEIVGLKMRKINKIQQNKICSFFKMKTIEKQNLQTGDNNWFN